MYKFTQGILPLVMLLQKLPIFFNDYYYSELNCDSCVKVLYTKKYKFETKIEYVQDKIYSWPKNFTQAFLWRLWQIPDLLNTENGLKWAQTALNALFCLKGQKKPWPKAKALRRIWK